MDIKDRIKLVMDTQKMSQQEFAQVLGITPGSLSGILNERTRPTNNHTSAIHRAFPNISIPWLLFGEGEMYTTASSQEIAPENAPEPRTVSPEIDSPSLFENSDVLPFAAMPQKNQQNAVQSSPQIPSSFGISTAGHKPTLSSPTFQRSSVPVGTTAPAGFATAPDAAQRSANVQSAAPAAPHVETKIVKEKVIRKVREIRVFYDDGTYEAFTPSN